MNMKLLNFCFALLMMFSSLFPMEGTFQELEDKEKATGKLLENISFLLDSEENEGSTHGQFTQEELAEQKALLESCRPALTVMEKDFAHETSAQELIHKMPLAKVTGEEYSIESSLEGSFLDDGYQSSLDKQKMLKEQRRFWKQAGAALKAELAMKNEPESPEDIDSNTKIESGAQSEDEGDLLINIHHEPKDYYKPLFTDFIRYNTRLQCHCIEKAPIHIDSYSFKNLLLGCNLYKAIVHHLKTLKESSQKLDEYCKDFSSNPRVESRLIEVQQRIKDLVSLKIAIKEYLEKNPGATRCIFGVVDLLNHIKQDITLLQNIKHDLPEEKIESFRDEELKLLEAIDHVETLRERIERYNRALLNA